MKNRRIYSYFIKENAVTMLVAMTSYIVVTVIMNIIIGKETGSSISAMSIITIFMLCSFNKDENFARYSILGASRKRMYHVQLICDLLLAVIMSMVFGLLFLWPTFGSDTITVFKFTGLGNGFTGAEFVMMYFCLIILIESILTFDSFRKKPVFSGMFSTRKSERPVIGFFLYLAIAILMGLASGFLEDIKTKSIVWICYLLFLAVSCCFYLAAKHISTKKEF